MKKLIFYFLGVALFIAIVGIFTKQANPNLLSKFSFYQKGQVNNDQVQKTPLEIITVGNTSIEVEIADTEEERKTGLSQRDSLPSDRGMLFIFENKDVIRSFWMKGMRFPLDFIWIDNGKIIQIDKNVPAPAEGTPDSELMLYTPGQPVDYVLEVNANFSDENNINPGDPVEIPESILN